MGLEVGNQDVEVSGISMGRPFPGVVELPPASWRDKEEKEAYVEAAIGEATRKGRDPDTIWTYGSRLEGGGVGGGAAWYEKVTASEREGPAVFVKTGFFTTRPRRKGTGNIYQDRHRSFERAKSGWRSGGFGMGGSHEVYDTELAALAFGLIQLHGRGEARRAFTVFTDSVAAMRRIVCDAPGPGQEMAVRIIEIAQRVVDQGNSITVKWTPAHRGVE